MTSQSAPKKLIFADLPDQPGGHGPTVISTRQFDVDGQQITIEASYRILVDGQERDLHFMVGDDGKVTTGLMPYRTYNSLVQMVRDLMRKYPRALVAWGGGQGDA